MIQLQDQTLCGKNRLGAVFEGVSDMRVADGSRYLEVTQMMGITNIIKIGVGVPDISDNVINLRNPTREGTKKSAQKESPMQADHKIPVMVMYRYVGGSHFFVSKNREVGLCVAHENMKTAFEAVAPTLEWLFEQKGMNVKFAPRVKFLEFRNELRKAFLDEEMPGGPDDIFSSDGGFQWKEAA